MFKWHYMDTEGRPKKEGLYWTALIFDDWGKNKEDNKKCVIVAIRYLCDAQERGLESWKMDDEPNHGLVWTTDSSGMPNEKVWAWAELGEVPLPERLPDNIKKWPTN